MNRVVFFSLLTAVLLSGCATRTDCESAHEAGLALGLSGQPPAGEDRPVDRQCRERFDVGMQEGLARFCDPRSGFRRALDGAEDAAPCDSREFRIDFNLGRQIRELRAERRALIEADGQETDADPAASMRLRIIDRELSQLEGVARIRGLLPDHPDRDASR